MENKKNKGLKITLLVLFVWALFPLLRNSESEFVERITGFILFLFLVVIYKFVRKHNNIFSQNISSLFLGIFNKRKDEINNNRNELDGVDLKQKPKDKGVDVIISSGQKNVSSKEKERSGCKIMLFEDDLFIGEMYEKKFLTNNFEVKRFIHPNKNVLEDIENFKPDIILTNIIMPKMDGFKLIEKIRQEEKFNNILIAVITNMNDRESIDKALILGANEYWVYSFYTPDEIVEKIKKILGLIST